MSFMTDNSYSWFLFHVFGQTNINIVLALQIDYVECFAFVHWMNVCALFFRWRRFFAHTKHEKCHSFFFFVFFFENRLCGLVTLMTSIQTVWPFFGRPRFIVWKCLSIYVQMCGGGGGGRNVHRHCTYVCECVWPETTFALFGTNVSIFVSSATAFGHKTLVIFDISVKMLYKSFNCEFSVKLILNHSITYSFFSSLKFIYWYKIYMGLNQLDDYTQYAYIDQCIIHFPSWKHQDKANLIIINRINSIIRFGIMDAKTFFFISK